MAYKNSQWEELGRNVQDIVEQAVNSHDYQKLGQTIRQTVSRAVDLGSARKAEEKPQIIEQQDVSVLYSTTGGITTRGVLKIVGGGLLCGVSLVMLLASVTVLLFGGYSLTPALWTLTLSAGGIGLIGSGIGNLNLVSRFKSYKKALGPKTYCTLEKLARAAGKNVKTVKKDLEKLISRGVLPEGHLNNEGTMVITSHETYRYFEQSRLQLEERKRQEAALIEKKKESTHSPQVRDVLDKGEEFLNQIRKCNDGIPGEEISRKIYQLENIVERIFERVDTNPEVIPDLKKMMDYYLPMTVKLLRAYEDMDVQPVQGETIRNSKREIEKTLDTLNLAFEKLLDELFEDTALDVSSDISVLNTLLAQEGLVEDDLTKMRKQKTP
ncbi:MAG: 5-bromo-4-chloroindolyl phosphate hydrolysis family protein [Oscillospiraceae bacterium]|nr:5-bromo-4-chloroindolyl phosphate hydrolysis family protein [Oscillospiraceae bacterium]